MSYHHLTRNELIFIEEYTNSGFSARHIAQKLGRSKECIYRILRQLQAGLSAPAIFLQYQRNKKKCGRKPISLDSETKALVKERIGLGWTPDTIASPKPTANTKPFPCSMKTLYRMFSEGIFDKKQLPMKGKRKPNGHQEKRGKEAFKRRLGDRAVAFPGFDTEFGHLEGDTIVGKDHKSALITLVERTSKAIIVLKVISRKAVSIEEALHQWLSGFPSHFFKSITFDNGKEFSRWKQTANQHDMAIFFADAGKPCQRPLNENSNGFLRRNGLPKQMDFDTISQQEVNEIIAARNNLPRKSLDYLTPIECFLQHADVSRLI
ncbi:IS30 family transposase [Listeria sp. FSL L7-1582]|uniref:IS30 family transposase n=1 Tax=Listeria portnoyi TaxID=2713504 RepID=UPI00164D4A62|nr:IS30 family transposase [Listeria portnoyi]MBC6310021.1 IS30 family transposase [Listeria portnoyi]